MSFNRYNTRKTGKFNIPGNFVPSSEGQQQGNASPAMKQQQNQFGGNWQPQPPMPQPPLPPQLPPMSDNEQYKQNENKIIMEDMLPPQAPQDNDMEIKAGSEMDESMNKTEGDQNSHPYWMKKKLTGVKKISNRERRRRKNVSLRRLLSPKNALMVLNEMLPNEQLSAQFQVEAIPNTTQYSKQPSFIADLLLDGKVYKGSGDNKLTARNAAAELAIRDIIISKMNKVLAAEAAAGDEEGGEAEETLPMIQLASFALHKLFCEWEQDGLHVPQLRELGSPSESELGSASGSTGGSSRKVKPPKQLPGDAAQMHPCMLLTYMRPSVEYRELAATGDRPQNMQFTIGVDVDGATYIGKAQNKKEARKEAAKAACKAIFGVNFVIPQAKSEQ